MKIDVKVYRKFLVALSAALAQLLIALADERVTVSEWVMVALAALGALGVYAVPNVTKIRKERKRDEEGRFVSG